jgi:hypothetical protein
LIRYGLKYLKNPRCPKRQMKLKCQKLRTFRMNH